MASKESKRQATTSNELWSSGRPPHPTHNWKIHRDLLENMPQSEGIYPLLSPTSIMEMKKQNKAKLVFCFQNCLPSVRKNYSSDREKLLKFEAEGQEFAKKN